MDLNRIRLKALMARYDLSIADVAGLLAISHQTIKHWTSSAGERRISDVLLARLDLAVYEREVAHWPALDRQPVIHVAIHQLNSSVAVSTFFCPYCREEHSHLVDPGAESLTVPPGSIGCRPGRWTPYLDHGYLLV